MPQVSDIMTSDVCVIEPQETVRRAAQLMQEMNIGSLPVCDGERLLGMLTDRDITVRAVAEGMDGETTCVSDVMSIDVHYCSQAHDAQEVLRLMGDKQIRRLPVVDSEHNLIGIVSIGDMALRQNGHVDRAVREISEPDAATRLIA